MVEAHTIDSWTRATDRERVAFGVGGIVGGFAAPFFLFLAGVAVPLAIASKVRRGAEPRAAARAVQRRGWEVFGLALLFRLQAKLLGGGAWAAVLRVDILNIMGPAIALAAAIVGWKGSRRGTLVALAIATTLAGVLTPSVRSAAWLAPLPDYLEAYLRPVRGLANFTVFPWAGFVLAGALAGALLAPARDERAERRLNVWFGVTGLGLLAGAYAASYLPPVFGPSYFWTSSPAFFAMRVGILTLALPLAFLWARRPTGHHWSWMQQFGRTSLFVYWIHVEMVYGTLSQSLHRALSLPQWAVAYVLFLAFLLGVSVLKDRAVRTWRGRATGKPATKNLELKQ